jgi:TolA-binding protein
VVSFHSTKVSAAANATITSSGSSSAAERAAAAELQSLLKSMQDQIKQLQTSLPETIQNELKSHHQATQELQQQQQQQKEQPQEREREPPPRRQQERGEPSKQQPPAQGVWVSREGEVCACTQTVRLPCGGAKPGQ